MKKGGLEVFGRYKKLIQYLVSDCAEKATPLTTNANIRYPVEMTQIVQELRTVMGSFFRTEEEKEMSRNSCEIVKFIRELADTSDSGLTQAIMRDPEGACTLQSKLMQQVDTPTENIEPLLLLEPLPVLPPFLPGAALEKLAPIEMVHIMGPTQQLQWFGFRGRAGEEATLMESHDKDYELLIKDLGWRILKVADGQVVFFPVHRACHSDLRHGYARCRIEHEGGSAGENNRPREVCRQATASRDWPRNDQARIAEDGNQVRGFS
jgi:hypothetical protein